MKTRKIKNPKSIGWIVVLIVMALLYSSYYLIYIPQQEAKLKERGFRILKEYAENIHDKQEHFKSHLKNYAAFYSIKSRYTKDEFEDLLHKSRPTRNYYYTQRDGIDEVCKDIYGVIKNLHESIVIDSSPLDITSYKKAIQNDSITFLLDNSSYESIGKYLTLANDLQTITDKKAKMPVSFLMEGLKFDRLFENISLLDDSGILYNSNGNVVDDITQTHNLLDTLNKKQGGIILKLEINGVKNQVMVLPIQFMNQKLYLAGFIPDTEFKKKTRTINSQFLTIIAGILLLLLIGMPILKIIFVSSKERLNVNDAHFATISLILSLSILLLIFIGTVKYYIIDKTVAGERIECLSNQLVTNVEGDFETLFDLADSIVSGVSQVDTFAVSIRNILDLYPNMYPQAGEIQAIYKQIPEKVWMNNFPINEVLLIDSEGVAINAATKTVFSDVVPLNLSKRNYFLSHKNNESWDFDRDCASKLYIESIKSYNSGAQETAISFCLNKNTFLGKRAPYMVITSHIPTLYDQVLPPDVQFVVIDDLGEVLFHSDQSKNLHENFLIESKYHPKLKAALKYRTLEKTVITYNEREWLARIVPLENKPFSHVTLIDLQYADNRNTQIYLFTFYFLLFTFFCIWVGIEIIKRLRPKQNFLDTKTWAFKWLMFHRYKIKYYKKLLLVQSVLFLCQFIGLFVIIKPVEMLVYQLIFIAFSGFIAVLVLGRTRNLKTLIVIGAIILFSIITLFVLNIKTHAWLVLLIPVTLTLNLYRTRNNDSEIKLHPKKTKRVYLRYMFIWLVSLTLLPVFTFYKSIEVQEDTLWEKSRMLDVAKQNVHLKEQLNEYETKSWVENINGNGIDKLLVSEKYTSADSVPEIINKHLTKADSTYIALPGIKQKHNFLMPLLKRHNIRNEWLISDALEIYYSTAETKSGITVSSAILDDLGNTNGVLSASMGSSNFWRWFFLLLIPITLFFILVWILFNYLADIVLHSVLADWKTPNHPTWQELINFDDKNPVKRILLISTQSNIYLTTSDCLCGVKVIHADEISGTKYDTTKIDLNENQKIIWIKGLETEILNIDTYDQILENLKEIEKVAADRKIVIETPIDAAFITEYFEDYILEYDVKKEEEIKIVQKIRTLNNFFKDYFSFTGKIDRKSILAVFESLNTQNENEQNLLANSHLMKLRYNHIWNNLSRMEKLILFDLADDGMLNTKNKYLINRLKMKGLVTIKPYPKIFTPSFKYFLKFSINPEETKQIENKVSKNGQWRNTKYLILLILIPLAALVFISQGTSIEKIIGIFTGIVALFSGAMRLMDTNLFRSSTK